MRQLSLEKKIMKETIIDLQAWRMRDNIVISGILEREDLEVTIKVFMQKQLKRLSEAVKNIAFHRVHRLGKKRLEGQRPRALNSRTLKRRNLSRGQEIGR